jgi:ribosomal protein S18 acetylase RimI-like enzyme
VGKEITARLLRLAAGHRKIILYAAPGKEGFYKRVGFRRMKTAMAIFPNPDAAMARGYLEA